MMQIKTIISCLFFLMMLQGCSKRTLKQKESKINTIVHSKYIPVGYQLEFNDEFDQLVLDLKKWKYRLGVKSGGGYASKEIEENVYLADGKLIVRGVYKDPKAEGSNSGGGVISIPHFKYGYYEARVKTQSGAFWHSSFWTYNTKDTKKATEIDIFERDSQYDIPDGIVKIRQNVIQHSSGKPITLKGSIKLPLEFDPSKDYHIYGMLWEESSVKFYVDGVLTNTISYPEDKYLHDETAIFLSMIARNTAAENTACYFDYVRFYSKSN
ncbi:glycoside hydrolase family 16 protein [Pedobacter sp. SD-b]|uniref:Glycoside hydrolase family 16 protein n=1 Tax=Pedobacter segetis TaxID=2793069 RepID=A0ABS1BMZ7_9SPHI|nr:glycoside hydrolase family 16 protein [Pedobacter segetis]MBK0383574.1 glycoside hydrolase family 16 protein [Pedobacter segetis]